MLGGRAVVGGVQKLAFPWFMRENLAGWPVALGQAAFLPGVGGGWGLGGPVEVRPQTHLCWVCTLSHPILLETPQKA